MGMPPVVATATLQCSFGLAPSTLSVLPIARVLIEGKPAATIADSVTALNIPPFGMCTTLSNPTVAAATAAALGILTPMPCVPVPGPWLPVAPRTLVGGKPVLGLSSKCVCSWGGVISIANPGSVRGQVG